MKRHVITERPDWMSRVANRGFTFHTMGKRGPDGNGTYWYEGVCYEFTLEQVERIESATEQLHQLCLEAVDYVVKHPELMQRMGIPAFAEQMIIDSWERRDPYVYGRFDLGYDAKTGAIKMFEYNADTPTTLVESALIQWDWLQDVYPDHAAVGGQFNSIHEKLIARWGEIKRQMDTIAPGAYMHMSSIKDNIEEFATVEYMRDCAYQAEPRLDTEYTAIEDIELALYANGDPVFRGLPDPSRPNEPGDEIRFWFKLYPWEWLLTEQWAQYMPKLAETIGIIEAPWKLLLSNKAILPVLWMLRPNHPLLLPAYFDDNADGIKSLGDRYIRKPIFGREGGNMLLVNGEKKIEIGGTYGHHPVIYQGLFDMPQIDGQYVQIGSWVVGDEPAGMIVREDESPVIINSSRVCPHYFVEK